MRKTTIVLGSILLSGAIASGCMHSKEEKIRAIVLEFNKLSPQIRNEIFRNAEAEASHDTVTLSFVLNAYPNEIDKPTYAKIGPAIAAGIVKSLPGSEDLLEEGAIFRVVYVANDGSEILDKVLGKKQILALTEDKSRFFNANSGKPVPGSKSRLAPNSKEMLRVMNQNLPIVNKEAGTSVVRIDVDEKNELVYSVEVSADLAKKLRSPGTMQAVHNEMAREPNLRRMFPVILPMGIEVVRYEYLDQKGKAVANVRFTQDDLK